jgi:hypothetical protein
MDVNNAESKIRIEASIVSTGIDYFSTMDADNREY